MRRIIRAITFTALLVTLASACFGLYVPRQLTLAKNGKAYVAFEFANADTLENAKINHQKGIDYLNKNF